MQNFSLEEATWLHMKNWSKKESEKTTRKSFMQNLNQNKLASPEKGFMESLNHRRLTSLSRNDSNLIKLESKQNKTHKQVVNQLPKLNQSYENIKLLYKNVPKFLIKID